MRKMLPYFGIAFVLAAIAGWRLEPARLFIVIQPIVVCLSIMAAAIFVRLNRGMPTLDWKSVPPPNRKDLTKRIVDITFDYVIGLAINSAAISSLIAFSALGINDLAAMPQFVPSIIVGAVCLVVFFAIVWMGYVVWRDYDIVRLQRKLLDDSADKDAIDLQTKEATKKIEDSKAANLHSNPTTVKSWSQ